MKGTSDFARWNGSAASTATGMTGSVIGTGMTASAIGTGTTASAIAMTVIGTATATTASVIGTTVIGTGLTAPATGTLIGNEMTGIGISTERAQETEIAIGMTGHAIETVIGIPIGTEMTALATEKTQEIGIGTATEKAQEIGTAIGMTEREIETATTVSGIETVTTVTGIETTGHEIETAIGTTALRTAIGTSVACATTIRAVTARIADTIATALPRGARMTAVSATISISATGTT
jgi:hypothetical protein